MPSTPTTPSLAIATGPSTPGPGGGVSSGGISGSASSHQQTDVAILHEIITFNSGTVTTSATLVPNDGSGNHKPAMRRNKVIIVNCEAAGGNTLYVGFESSLSTTRFYYALAPGAVPLELYVGALVKVYLYGSAANTDYLVMEARVL